jgi:hypothetical protein
MKYQEHCKEISAYNYVTLVTYTSGNMHTKGAQTWMQQVENSMRMKN